MRSPPAKVRQHLQVQPHPPSRRSPWLRSNGCRETCACDLLQRSSMPEHRAGHRMSKNVGGTPAWTTNARTAQGLRHDHGDGTVAGEWTKRCAGSNEKRVVVDGLLAVLDIGDERIANLLGHRQQGLAAALSDNAKGCRSSNLRSLRQSRRISSTPLPELATARKVNRRDHRGCASRKVEAACSSNDSLDFLGLQKPRQGRKSPVCERGNACVRPAAHFLSAMKFNAGKRSHGGGALFPVLPSRCAGMYPEQTAGDSGPRTKYHLRHGASATHGDVGRL